MLANVLREAIRGIRDYQAGTVAPTAVRHSILPETGEPVTMEASPYGYRIHHHVMPPGIRINVHVDWNYIELRHESGDALLHVTGRTISTWLNRWYDTGSSGLQLYVYSVGEEIVPMLVDMLLPEPVKDATGITWTVTLPPGHGHKIEIYATAEVAGYEDQVLLKREEFPRSEAEERHSISIGWTETLRNDRTLASLGLHRDSENHLISMPHRDLISQLWARMGVSCEFRVHRDTNVLYLVQRHPTDPQALDRTRTTEIPAKIHYVRSEHHFDLGLTVRPWRFRDADEAPTLDDQQGRRDVVSLKSIAVPAVLRAWSAGVVGERDVVERLPQELTEAITERPDHIPIGASILHRH